MSAPRMVSEREAGPTLDALASICSDKSYRPALQRPFTVAVAGATWTVATDGMRLAAVRRDYGAVPADPGIAASVQNFYATATAPGAIPVALSSLRDFFAAHAPPPLGTCPDCNGSAEEECDECDGDGMIECECLECGDAHERKCKACDGHGTFTCARCKDRDAKVPVKVGIAAYDARLMSPLFAMLPDGEALFRQTDAHSIAGLVGDGWFALMMPLRLDGDWSKVPTLNLAVSDDVVSGREP